MARKRKDDAEKIWYIACHKPTGRLAWVCNNFWPTHCEVFWDYVSPGRKEYCQKYGIGLELYTVSWKDLEIVKRYSTKTKETILVNHEDVVANWGREIT